MVTLQDVTIRNWRDCIHLSVCDSQRGFVASNLATIAESRFNPHFRLRAIYAGDQMVGFLAYCHENEPEDLELYWIFRLMIDQNQQRKGFAIEAMRLAIAEIESLGGKRIKTMHKPANVAAGSMYPKLGFIPSGRLDDGDYLLELELNNAG